jgi:hypothetical protein
MASKLNALHATEGYTFQKTGTHAVALMGGHGATGTTFTCGCDKSGGCRVDMEGTTASCENDGCTGSCTWSIHLPGLSGVIIAARISHS